MAYVIKINYVFSIGSTGMKNVELCGQEYNSYAFVLGLCSLINHLINFVRAKINSFYKSTVIVHKLQS